MLSGTAEELRRKIESGDDVLVVDLRHAVDFEPGALTVAGAQRVAPDALEAVLAAVPPEKEVVLFCTWAWAAPVSPMAAASMAN